MVSFQRKGYANWRKQWANLWKLINNTSVPSNSF